MPKFLELLRATRRIWLPPILVTFAIFVVLAFFAKDKTVGFFAYKFF
jgi:hypothetical protein